MIVYKVGGSNPPPLVSGATLGQQHLEALLEILLDKALTYGKNEIVPVEPVVLSFSGIESATASYVKALLLPLLDDLTDVEDFKGKFRPNTFVMPFVADLTDELRGELWLVMKDQGSVYLEAQDMGTCHPISARIIGELDGFLKKTISIVVAEEQCTATDLYAKYPSEGISTTGWNNRLADLYELRVIDRRKCGRQWIYSPVVKEVVYG
ncbi:MAG TPA: hypothetical protein VGK19_18355 [Capsulimonadaceae bacterium]|jgi:hypothetical protein